MKWFKTFLALFILFTQASIMIGQESSKDGFFELRGNLIYDMKKFPDLSVYVSITEDGNHYKALWCDHNGNFSETVYPGHVYKLEFTADGHEASKVEVNTTYPSNKLRNKKLGIIDIEFNLFEKQKYLDPVILEKPLLKVKYLASSEKFTYDYSHTERVNQLISYLKEKDKASKRTSSSMGSGSDVMVLMTEIETKEDAIKKLENENATFSAQKQQLDSELVYLQSEVDLLNELLGKCDTSERIVFIETIREINDHGGMISARKSIEIQYQNARTAEDSALIAMKEARLNMIENELKEANADIIQKELDIQQKDLEVKTQRQRVLYMTIGIGAILLLSVFLFISFQKTRRANILITEQKLELEIKNDEIQKSINYAKRIQEAILPPANLVSQYLTQSFIFYRPKDIVAGDFYWFDHQGDDVYFAAADCTGHGVPGAMVSVVCANALNRAVHEMKISDPAAILDKTRELVLETFSRSQHEVNDGMDIAFCKLNLKTRKLWFSGAHNPLYRITPIGDEAKEKTPKTETHMLLEYKGDKQPIGRFSFERPFTQDEVQLKEGDIIYIFSDGYADQFGGPENRKYMYKNFKKLFLDLHELDIDKQKEKMADEFDRWRGGESQIDDVVVIGVKV